MADVPKVFNQPGTVGFAFMRAGEKFPPIDKGWEKKPHTYEEATAYDGNVGLIAGNGYIGLDQDDPEAFKGLKLPATTIWETRPGRLGMWFKCDDRAEALETIGKKADLAQLKLFDSRRVVNGYHPHIGEIKLERTYQVIPSSWKTVDGQRADYKMLDSSPPAAGSLSQMLSALMNLGIVFSEKPRLETNAAKLDGMWRRAADGQLDKTAKAREFLLEASMRAKPGYRNDTGFWLACQLRDLGLNAGDASAYLRKYAVSLEGTGEPYTPTEAMRSIEQAYSKEPREPPKRATEEPAIEPRVKQAAENIMKHGDVLKFLVRQAQRNHVGDTDILKHLFASVACTNSLTSAGIQPELNGEKGHGKTDAVKAVFHCVPAKWKLSASVSAKALYYYKDLRPGTILFSDDIQWSEDLISTVKRSTGNFQEPQIHFTLDKNREPLPHEMPARLVWWLSSVESVADDQLKDRQYSLDIDEGGDHAVEVSDYLRRVRSQKKIRFSVDWRIDVAKEIINRIKEHEPFKVVIDCAEHAEWKVKEDHRTQNKFWDLVEAFAILRFEQREIDADGWLHASVEDFNEAKTIFMRRKANHRTHLTNAQARIVKAVIALQKDAEGATQARIAENLGISFQAVSKSIKAIEANTQYIVHSRGQHGEEFYKCTVAAIEVAYEEGDIVSLSTGA